MWERFKKKVTDLIYEEIEEDQEADSSTEKELQHVKKQDLGRNQDREEVKTRMTFQYPRKETESFRFPVIPDALEPDSQRAPTSRSRRRSQPISGMNQPAF